ncbi:E3 ubiquitin-protein ligase HUWE1 isoform X25 [Homo sapiens]|uniref:E3 ubiquitin-protein ligase HUWE1 isoform 6 n=1 Tax=Homo sapiens TaxID=9606 RepID=UPI000387BDE4|nr:E3 ubiquitin-protein ligase HUWE1 isoform X25 [Homo sapiens]XP_047297707.1 E3 ubiquitin-protein ligase HUWE1 isoform X25 [Homo sapiens]XP_054182302.1 E3 ubiquitin-protein ligase HUWE1 isoform X25 [Homo sapiens]XP_054182303.1 E3 ubiquitin-protein ligase HUWE1 isoform X25 [Homo sapiens]
MKVDRTKLKKTPTEAPADCRALIDKLKVCNDEQLLLELQQIKTWNIGKCELYHWVDLLDRFDGILADAGQTVENMSWMLVCDRPEREQLKMLLLAVLNFTALLIEYSFSRHLYSSIEHLTTLLASSDMQVVLAVLNLLYVFSKRSNYITRLGSDKRTPLLTRLQHLAESWGGKENGFGLAECCRDLHMMKYPPSATTLHFEFYADPGAEVKIEKRTTSNTLHYIHIEQLDKISESPSEIMESLTKMYSIPKDKQMLLFTHIRLAHGFSNHRKRLQAVQARLHAISILVYSNALQESANSILYNGLIEELVDVLQITDKQLMEIKAASLRTLTSIVHLERTPKLSSIIDCTGTASYHGFLPVLVRNCIQAMIDPSMDPYPHQFATALFSFLYHLASYDAGGEALVSCGMMEALLKVIKFLGDEQDQITFVTRAVRVVDLITNLDMAAFQSHSGLSIFIYRLEHEVDLCRKECPFVIKPKIQRPNTTQEGEEMETDMDGVQCIPQRAALLKSMLNFLKKAIQDPAFSDGIRHVMDGSLPTSLKHIISNAEYYGPSLFLLATEVVTVFVFQEPSLLSSLQDNGLTDVMLHALLIKDVPATREVLGSLPNVFSALCLNARGLQSFVQCQPFERLFKVLLSPDYLPAMRRRRSSDPLGDTASNLGSAVDELMRHQPTLKTDATTAIIKLLEEICNLGRDPKYICQKPSIQKADGTATAPPPRSNHAAEEASSEDEEEEEVQAMQSFNSTQQNETEPNQQVVGTEERIPIPLMDYILNVMKFVESILSNNTTDDHCQEFVNQKGLLPLVTILGLPNLPIDFPTSAACQAVAGVCKSILTLSHEPKVLQEGLLQLDSILSSLEPLHRPIESPGGSVLLRELACAGNVADATLSAQATPLLHALTAAHAYIMMFVHTCRVGQSEIRSISVNQWGSQLGLSVLSKLSQLYCSLVWESTVLLSLCTPNSLPSGCEFGQADMQKLVPKDEKAGTTQGGKRSDGEQDGAAGSMDASTQGLLEGIGLDGDTLAPMETDEPTASDSKGKSKITPAMAARIKQIKPLLSASSRLGRALAELFGLLVKLCVGSPVRQRRSHHAASTTTAPTPAARSTASALTKLLTKGLSWQPPPYTPTPRFRLTFFICSVGFTSPMLFDERKYPYHLMLQKFLCSGGHNALFETFNWALSMGGKVPVSEGLEHSDLPDGTGEFLDAWLMLVEKMVNPTTVLESPHSLPAKLPGGVQNFPQFSALRFLVVTQKAAFTCIKNLWNRKPLKVYGGRMAESMLAILCHILRGEPVIRERLSKEKEGSRGEEDTGQEEGGSRREPQVNQQQLQQLMDMGFTREHAMEALLNTSTMEQATEYLLTHPPPIMGGVVRDLSMSEEDQMMRAIAMSLGQDIPMDQRAESPEEVACRKEEEERKAREKQEEEEAKCLEKFQDADPLEQDELHTFTDTMLPGCFHLLDELPDTVYRVCDLIMTAIKRNGADYRDMILKQVVNQVWEAADVLIKAALPLTTSDTKTVSEWISQMATLPQASNLATRILLLTLLFEELKLPCAWVVESSGILNVLIKLLEVVQPCLQAAKEQKEVQTPKWITPVLLLIDFYEKTAISSKRRAQMTKYLQSNSNNWRWFDDRSGRWCSYSASNNSTIDSAWKSGETSVRFTAGRRRYTVQFTTMVQVNEETGNRRPVMLTLLRVPRLNKNSKNSNGQELEKTLEESKEMDIKRKENKGNDTPLALESTNTEKETSLEETKIGEILIQGLTEDMVTVLIRACVSMLGVPVDPDTLHATLRLCLRLTRDHKYAMMFAELKSTRMILNLTQSSGFNGFTPLVTLLLRHIIEDPCTLRHTMEKVVRSAATSGAGSTTSGVVSGSLGSREINYILRVLGPAACRNPDIFTEVANCCIRIALPAPRGSGTASDDEFENLRIKGPNAVQLVKTTPLKPSPLPVIPDTIKEVIYDMLNALAAYHAPEEADKSDPKPGVMTQEVGQLLQDMGDDVYQQYRSLTRQSSDFDTQSGFSINSQVFAADGASTETSASGTSQGEASTPEESRDGKKDKEGDRASEEGKQKGKGSKPLMPTSTILRLLAELVRSYVGIATLIANYSYTVGQSELIKEDCSVLAFVLDHLLPHTQNAEDKDTPALARLFLASLAAAGSGTDAQVALVNEVKAALGRALAMAESTEKHARLQAVMCIISTIMESCPSTSSFYSSATAKTQHNGMNNIIRLFLKKGLVNDLARVPHSLDLSSPNMANTVNAALKPLETLSRIVNQPSSLFGSKSASSKNKSEQDAQGASQDSSSNQQDPGEPGEAEVQEEDHDVTQTEVADGDIMDGEAETDSVVIAGQPEVLSSQEMQVENELEDLIDELLERDGGSGNSTIIADIPPSPGNIPTTHPLMVRHADHSSLTLGSGSSTTRLTQGIGRSQRTLRQLTANTGHTIHVHYPGNRQPNPPLILQRLLGPSAAADILQLSSSLPLQSRGRARLLVGNDDVHIIARSDDELLDDFFHDQSTATSQAGTLSSIPTALTRWTEECKVLDAESMHDCVSVVKVSIVNHLEFLRDEELEERREKRRKQLAEEETKITDKGKEDKENRDQSAQCTASKSNDSTEQNLSDGTPMPDSYPTTPSSTDAATSESKETLGTLQSSQQQPTLPTPPALGEVPQELQSPAGEGGSSTQLLMPVEPEELGPTRPSGEAETTQMELSPAPTITSLSPERAEDSDALTAVSSQLEGSPMDTSSLASCTLEEAVGDTSAAGSSEQPRAGSSTPGDAPPAVAEVQGRSDGSGESAQPPEDSSPPASSESSSTRDSAVAISGADSRGILEEPLPSTSSEEEDPLAGISLPEGVDPSFLAALPDDIRREVLQNQLGIRPPTRTAPSTNSSAPAVVGNPGVTEVSPEFLAALPPAIQEEVLAQQRAEQQRRELAQNASSDTPMDPVTFIQTLPSDLRRSVLEDMEDSVLAVMPPDIAAEAQALRREQEARQRQLMHERLFGHSSTSALSAILRSPAFTSRLSGNRGVQYTRLAVQRGGTFQMGGSSSHNRPSGSNVDTLLRLRGRLLLDHEALSCLLVLLFVDEPKLNTSRLHRVLRNLCYHAQTRHWVIRSLLSILQRSSESELCIETPKLTTSEEKGKKSSKSCGSSSHENRPLDLLHKMESKSSNQLSWLSVSMDAALGCRTNIFQIQRSGGRKHTEKHASGGSTVHIHPQAAPVVCRHVLDTLIQLAKVFPSHFTQQRTKETNCESDRERGNKACSPCSSQSSSSGICTDFWDLLVKLDNMNVSRKGKNSVKSVPVSAGGEGETSPYSLEASPLGQLMNMLSHPVIRRSSLLTEKLLRLLSLISIALPENKVSEAQANSGSGASSTTTATSTTSTTTTTAASTTPTPPTAPTPVTSAPALVAATAISTIVVAASTTVTTPTTATTTVSISPTTKGSKSPAKVSDGGSSSTDFKMVSSGLTENQLQLSVEVLTSHSCSEEGLEDAANVLLQLSRGDSGTRDTVLKLLLNGARHLGYTLCKQIGTLLAELREYNLEQQRRAQCETLSPDGLPEEQPQTTKLKGKMQSRFDMAENVVIVASQKRPLGGRELQLPSMSMLTSKTSTQKFFLRVLQVIIQLRDDTRRANKKAKQTGRLGSSGLGSASSIQAAVRQLEAEADAIIQMVREGQRARRQQQAATSESSQSEASVRREESPMDVDQPSPSAQDTQSIASDGTPQGEKEKEERPPELPLLSEQLSLDELWDMLGECLKELEESHDQHAVLVLQPAVEAFFLVHATERESKPPVRDTRESQLAHIKDEPPPLSPAPLTPATPSSLDPFFSREPSSMHISSSLPPDTQKFLRFAETHRTVLNQILRQSTTHLADGPFAVLVDYIRVLDFDVKRKYFRQELERLDEGLRKEDMAVHVRRDHVFEDSYRELHRKSPEEMKNRLYIVFEGEEGQDAGGLLREWYMIISREMFNPMYALFRTSPGDRVTYTINPSSHCNPNHLSYFKFVGRIVAKAVYDNRLLECYFTRSFYKHILGKSVRYTDMESEDYHFYQGLVYLLENDVSTLGYDLTFSTEVQEFGVCEVRDLKPNGANILVTEENKKEYVHLVCQMRMTGAIRKQLAAFLEGFYEIIPKRLISIFTEQELELLISGLPTIDIDDLKSNTEYHKYQSNSIQIQWFWRALRSFDQADRAKFLQFVTGTSKVPLQGFAALEGMNGIQKFQIHRDDRSTDRLPSAHTCFNQLDLPAYESFEKLRHMLLLAIQECSEGFGLA